MEAKNLRIGNLVMNDRVENTIVGILAQNINIVNLLTKQGNIINADIDLLKPMPLSEEWLIKFGFKKVGSNFEKDWLLLHKNIKTGTIDFLLNEPQTGKYQATVLKCVHQLQNLFFAITGTELELKNES